MHIFKALQVALNKSICQMHKCKCLSVYALIRVDRLRFVWN